MSASTEDWDAEDTQFSSDPNGNVIRVVENGAAKFDTIDYDHRNLPTRIVTGDGTEIVYRYNGKGQRIYAEGTPYGASKLAARRRNITLWMATRRWRFTKTVWCREAIPLGKYWNILANGVVGRYESGSGMKFINIVSPGLSMI